MKTISRSILCLGALLLTASLLYGQDLSKYRSFSLESSLASVLKLSNQRLEDVKTVFGRPMLIQELTWWPSSARGVSSPPDSVEQILFSFTNGQLYKISVTYDRNSTEGLTVADMVKSISAKYGPATSVASQTDPMLNARYNMTPKPLASWEDSQFSLDLVRSSFTDRLGLVIYSKRINTEAERAIAEAVKLDALERPEKEAIERKKESDNLEATRERNQKSFRP
jgi:hypothetical protein